ncbi:hypothetical protein EON66_00525 [archaeon]|nr:MAG: hypothetical protein EON66_00525 [archaeon]
MKLFAVALVRSLMLVGLCHRQYRIRLATLDAIDLLVALPDDAHCRGAGSEAIMALLGTRDANVVPISFFYGHDTSVNYFARLLTDPNTYVCIAHSADVQQCGVIMIM